MRALTDIDMALALLPTIVGAFCLYYAWGVWKARNGGILTRALCLMLALAGFYGLSEGSLLFQYWRNEIPVSMSVDPLRVTTRSMFYGGIAWVLLFAFPRATRKKE